MVSSAAEPLFLFGPLLGAHDGPLFFLLSLFLDRLVGCEKPSKKQLPISFPLTDAATPGRGKDFC
jgi:hypothetical protein